MNKRILAALIVFLIAAILLAYAAGLAGVRAGEQERERERATETFGAEVFHLQLTELARGTPVP